MPKKIVLYEKDKAAMVVDVSWRDIEEDEHLGNLVLESLRGDPDGAQALDLNGTRVVMISSSMRLVEVWEDGSRFDPDEVCSMVLDGFTYRRKPATPPN